jgi:hypothetical protein
MRANAIGCGARAAKRLAIASQIRHLFTSLPSQVLELSSLLVAASRHKPSRQTLPGLP